jgi:hypothetical protein
MYQTPDVLVSLLEIEAWDLQFFYKFPLVIIACRQSQEPLAYAITMTSKVNDKMATSSLHPHFSQALLSPLPDQAQTWTSISALVKSILTDKTAQFSDNPTLGAIILQRQFS